MEALYQLSYSPEDADRLPAGRRRTQRPGSQAALISSMMGPQRWASRTPA